MAGSKRAMRFAPAFFMSLFLSRSRARPLCRLFAAIAICAAFALPAQAQRRHTPGPLDTLGDEEVDPRAGWEILRRFQSMGIAGDYRLRFQLQIMPRREKTRRVSGVLLGSQGQGGPVSRVDLALEEAEVAASGAARPARVKRLLLQNGVAAYAMEADSAADDPTPAIVPSERYFEPLAGSDFTVFDLLMPYIYWQRFRYEGRSTLRGRPTHVFMMYPPEEDGSLKSHVSAVRLYIDEEVNAMVQVELYGPDEAIAKTVSIGSFKKVDDQWLVDEIDVRDESKRDKTRFKVLDANLGLDLPRSLFEPQSLTENVYGAPLQDLRPAKAGAE